MQYKAQVLRTAATTGQCSSPITDTQKLCPSKFAYLVVIIGAVDRRCRVSPPPLYRLSVGDGIFCRRYVTYLLGPPT